MTMYSIYDMKNVNPNVREIVTQLKAKVNNNKESTDPQYRRANHQKISLEEKIGRWRNGLIENLTPEVDPSNYCQGVANLEGNMPDDSSELLAYSKLITNNTTDEWLLATLSSRVVTKSDSGAVQSDDSNRLSISSFSEEIHPRSANTADALFSIVRVVATQLCRGIRGDEVYDTAPGICDGENTGAKSTSGGATMSTLAKTEGIGNGETYRFSKKRAREKADDNDDSDGDDSSHHPKRPVRLTEAKQKMLACPFWKMDPIKYADCFRMKFQINSRVKQHINRKHMRPSFYCQRCLLVFEDEPTLRAHVKQRLEPCTQNSGAWPDGINLEQQRQLSKKPKTPGTIEAKWFEIWDIVMPGRPRPKSAYIDSRLADCCSKFREHWENNGAELLVRAVRDSGIMSMTEVDEDTREHTLHRILEEGLAMIWEAWSPPQTSSQPPENSVLQETHENPSNIERNHGIQDLTCTFDSGIGLGGEEPRGFPTHGSIHVPEPSDQLQPGSDRWISEMNSALDDCEQPIPDRSHHFWGLYTPTYPGPAPASDQSDQQCERGILSELDIDINDYL